MKFSVILPVHNEEEMLRITLPSVKNLNPSEVVIIFDRCTDKSELIAKKILKDKLVSIHINKKSNWRHHLSYLYHLGVQYAKYDKMLFTQADIYLDSKMIDEIEAFKRGMVSFRVIFPLSPSISDLRFILHLIWNIMIMMVTTIPGLGEGFTGVFIIDKETYYKNPLKPDDELEFDSALLEKIKEINAPYKFINTKCLNLRPWKEGRMYELGKAKAKIGKGMWRVLAFSITRLMPQVFVGYLHERRRLKR